MHVSLANLNLDLSWDVVTILSRFPAADHILGSIAIVLGGLVPLTVELHGVGTGNVVDYLFFHIAIGGLNVCALIVILGSHIDLVCGIAHPIFASEAPLHLVCLLEGLVVDRLNQVTNQLVHIKAHTLNIGFNNTSAVVERLGHTRLLVLSVARPLNIRFALVLEYHLLDHVAVGVLVDTISPHICLPYVRVVLLGRSRRWILLWLWKGQHQ